MTAVSIIYSVLFIASNLLAAISGFLKVGYSTLLFLFVYLVFIVCAFSLFLVIIILIFNKKVNYFHIVLLALFLIDIGGYYFIYNLVRGYNEVNHYMKQNYKDYEIIGIKEAFIEQNDPKDLYGDFARCRYVFNVKVNDNTNNIFQAGYCEIPSFIITTKVIDSYNHTYLPYYFKKYQKNNNSSLKIEVDNNYLLHNPVVIHFNNSNYKELFDFFNYLETSDKHGFDFCMNNDDLDRMYYYNKRDDYFKFEIEDDINKKRS